VVPPDFDSFYAAHVRGLTAQLWAYTGNREQAQDVVQEAFCRAYARWSRVSTYDDPAAWVRRVAWNVATSGFRQRTRFLSFARRHRDIDVPEPSPDHVALTTALAAIPARQRRVIVLHYLADLSIADIAAMDGVSEGTVKSWLYRGRAALAGLLADARKEGRHA